MTTVFNHIKRSDVNAFKGSSKLLDDYQRIALQSAIYPGQGSILGLAYVALKMNGEAGEFAEHVGKSMRDDGMSAWLQVDGGGKVVNSGSSLTLERREKLIYEIGDELWYLSAACKELGISLGDAAARNLEKLCDRGERGKLAGSGDNR